jgi:shikimate dehydrogenase
MRDDSINYDNLEKEILNSDLIINTTPLGTYPNVENKIPIPYNLITNKHTCYDLIYNPVKTSFLNECEKKGAIIKNGLEMLELQAEASWDVWNS